VAAAAFLFQGTGAHVKHYTAFGETFAAARIENICTGDGKTLLVLQGEPYPISVPTGSHWRPGCYLTIRENGKLGVVTERFFQMFFSLKERSRK
jgi:hypothetical protein